MNTNNVPHKKKWNTGKVQMHVEPRPIPIIKSKKDEKTDKYFVKINLHRDPMSEK